MPLFKFTVLLACSKPVTAFPLRLAIAFLHHRELSGLLNVSSQLLLLPSGEAPKSLIVNASFNSSGVVGFTLGDKFSHIIS